MIRNKVMVFKGGSELLLLKKSSPETSDIPVGMRQNPNRLNNRNIIFLISVCIYKS